MKKSWSGVCLLHHSPFVDVLLLRMCLSCAVLELLLQFCSSQDSCSVCSRCDPYDVNPKVMCCVCSCESFVLCLPTSCPFEITEHKFHFPGHLLKSCEQNFGQKEISRATCKDIRCFEGITCWDFSFRSPRSLPQPSAAAHLSRAPRSPCFCDNRPFPSLQDT